MKKCLNNRTNHENLDLSRFFKNWTYQTKKKKVLKLIPYFASASCIFSWAYFSIQFAQAIKYVVNLILLFLYLFRTRKQYKINKIPLQLTWHYEGGAPSRRSFCLFWRETKQRPELEIFDATGSGQGNANQGVGKRNPEKAVGEGRRRGTVDTGQQKRPVGTRESPGAVREDLSRWVSIPRGFVEISRRMHINVSLQMHRKCSVTEPPFLHLSLTQANIVHLFFVLFLPLHQLYFLYRKEMCDTPVGTTRWIAGQDRIVTKSW